MMLSLIAVIILSFCVRVFVCVMCFIHIKDCTLTCLIVISLLIKLDLEKKDKPLGKKNVCKICSCETSQFIVYLCKKKKKI